MNPNYDFDSLDFDGFFDDEFGDTNSLLDDVSIVPSENSYDSRTTVESEDSMKSHRSCIPSKKIKKQRIANKPLSVYVDPSTVKKWETKQQSLTMSKMIKTDVRLSYTTIFQNVINIMGFPLVFEFFKHYCIPDFVFSQGICPTILSLHELQELSVIKEDDENKLVYKLAGLQSVSQFWFNFMQVLPDLVYQLKDTKIHTYSDSQKSLVISHYHVSATRIFDIGYDMKFPLQPPLKEQRSLLYPLKTLSEGEDTNIIDDSIRRYISTAQMCEPHKFTMDLQLVMHINENKSIARMEFTPIAEPRLEKVEV